ncbi:1340_t:CDS:2 [Gigaspora rosea]|nr:1340_t:CDS:2 [Gigaspora rosea]
MDVDRVEDNDIVEDRVENNSVKDDRIENDSTCYQKYVRIGCDLVEGSDIIAATKNLAGTYLANIEPNRNQKASESENLTTKTKGKKPCVETIAGISKYNFWQ